MISIALCDDEVKYLDYYENKIAAICQDNNLMYDIIRFKSGEALLFYLEDYTNKFDIIYLDILSLPPYFCIRVVNPYHYIHNKVPCCKFLNCIGLIFSLTTILLLL